MVVRISTTYTFDNPYKTRKKKPVQEPARRTRRCRWWYASKLLIFIRNPYKTGKKKPVQEPARRAHGDAAGNTRLN